MKRLFLILLNSSLIVLFIIKVSLAQDTLKTTINPNSKQQNIQLQPDTIELHNEIKQLKDDVKLLRDQVNSQQNLVYYVVALFTLFSFFGGVMTFLSYRNNERRAQNTEERAAEIHSLTINNDKSAQERTNKIFEESQKTLTLVNETLFLAAEASRRAYKSLETKLVNTMNEREREARNIIETSRAYEDDKNLTTDKDVCSEIHLTGRKIEGLENHLATLDSQIELKPHCKFIRGADSYLSEQFNQAIEYWGNVAYSNEADKLLKSLAYFWIGYINNNLGEFDLAIRNFKKAEELATDSRKYELIRIRLETRFFNKEPIKPIIDEFNNLLTLIEKDTSGESPTSLYFRKKRILTTLGNIYYQFANETSNKTERNNSYLKSKQIFAELLNLKKDDKNILGQLHSIDSAQKDKDKWIIFGFAESLYQSNEKRAIAKKIFKEIVYPLAENEFINREEKRSKVLAKATQLICAVRAAENKHFINNTKSQVDSALGGVDKRLTLYSQLQRRNVKREIFREDLSKLLGSADMGGL